MNVDLVPSWMLSVNRTPRLCVSGSLMLAGSLRHTLADIRIVTDTRTFVSEGTFIDIVADVFLSSRHFRDG